MSKCAIVGAGGHGKVVAELAELCGYTEIHFFDEKWPETNALEHWEVVGKLQSLKENIHGYGNIVVAIGNNATRHRIQQSLKEAGGVFCKLVHPKAIVSKYCSIGEGSVVMANAVINPFAKIGNCCIINTSAVIEHECDIDHAVHVCPSSSLAGNVRVNMESWIGIGSQVKQCINIGENVIVGAGATVVEDVPSNTTVIGTPARPIF
ncbi:acetyltransferase [Vibrio sp. HN007]|uniref:acetyltransferase n=1 Tax=Vibrio iocasae TaxID=3098914 RepID=UPI0035D49DD7